MSGETYERCEGEENPVGGEKWEEKGVQSGQRLERGRRCLEQSARGVKSDED